MFFPQGMYVNPQVPTPSNVPIPSRNTPKRKTSFPKNWPIRIPNKPSAPPIPQFDWSSNKRQPKDDPRKIKRSKKSNTFDHQADNFVAGVMGGNPTTPAGAMGGNPTTTAGPSGPPRSPLIPNGQGSPLTRGPINDNVQQGPFQDDWVSDGDEDDGGMVCMGIFIQYTLIRMTQFQVMCLNKPVI